MQYRIKDKTKAYITKCNKYHKIDNFEKYIVTGEEKLSHVFKVFNPKLFLRSNILYKNLKNFWTGNCTNESS